MGTNLILFVQKKQTRTHLIFFNKKHHILQVVIKYLNRATYIYLYINFSVFSEKDEKNEKKPFDKKMCFVLKNHSASVLLYTSIENYNLRKNITKVNFKSLSQNVAILFLLFFRRHQHENMKRRKLLPFFCTVLETPKKYYYYTYNSIIWKIW